MNYDTLKYTRGQGNGTGEVRGADFFPESISIFSAEWIYINREVRLSGPVQETSSG
jgi:hypothetical protein